MKILREIRQAFETPTTQTTKFPGSSLCTFLLPVCFFLILCHFFINFVSHDPCLSTETANLQIITGPNMSGKSTYLLTAGM